MAVAAALLRGKRARDRDRVVGDPVPVATGVDAERVIGRSLCARRTAAPHRRKLLRRRLRAPAALHAAILRSPHAHARIVSIDASAALEDERVVDVVTSDDLPHPLPRIPMRMFRIAGMEQLLQSPLADDRVRYSGEPVAVVIADSRYAAEDALELIEVVYEPLEPLLDATAALDPGSPVLHPGAGTNLAGEIHIGLGDVDAAFAEADLVVRSASTASVTAPCRWSRAGSWPRC